AKATLEKIVQAPQSYPDRVVVPLGMYHLALSNSGPAGNPRMCSVTERRLQRVRVAPGYEVQSGSTTTVELEPRLAERRDGVRPDQLEGKGGAIGTLWVWREGKCGLVGVEILQDTRFGIRTGYKREPDVDYQTLLVTPEGSEPKKGTDGDWEQLERMHLMARQ